MRIGIGSYTYPWAIGIGIHQPAIPMTAVQLVEKAADFGVTVVQICDNLPLDQMSPSTLAILKQRADTLGVAIEVGTRGIAPAHLCRHLEIAQLLQSPLVRVVVDTNDHHPDPAEVVSLIREVLPEYAHAGIALAIENHDRFTAAMLANILTQLDSPCAGICLDTVNSFGALEGPEVVVRTLAPWVLNLHVKDFTITRAGHMLGFQITGCPAGAGRLNLPWVLDQLAAAGRTPNAILEQWTPFAVDLDLTIQTEERWAQQSLAYLKDFIQNDYRG